ncbi:MAG: Uma2 family endonuclease [Chitinophagales bacterium]|nr:Uma2 family endonuclease [Hyphomicrobiales bacterium]
MTVDEFLDWAAERPGRHELVNGEVVSMAPERARHALIKAAVYTALNNAVKRAKLPCIVFPDGMTVKISDTTSYEPDAAVQCAIKVKLNKVTLDAPIIVAEVASPSTKRTDALFKLPDYFLVPSIQHYLIIDPDKRLVVHFQRAEADKPETRIVREGALRLDPPGLTLEFDELLPELPGDDDED